MILTFTMYTIVSSIFIVVVQSLALASVQISTLFNVPIHIILMYMYIIFQGAVLLYDISSRTTFTNVLSWMHSIREHGSPHIKIALVGHKTDLEDDRQVSTEEGQKVP